MNFDWIVDLISLGVDTGQFRERSAKRAKEKFDQQFNEACTATGAERDRLLAKFCDDCAHRLEKNPKDKHTLCRWGNALMWRATGISGNDADRLYEQADKKFAQALKIVPNDEEICASRVEAKRRRGLLHPDEAGRRLLTETCEMCEARVGIYAKGTFDAWILNTWGLALRDLAARETGAEADRLCEIAAEKLRQGYSLAPDQNQILSSRAEVLLWRASLHTGAQQREILGRVLEICEQLASQGSGGAGILQLWGDALSWLATSASASEAESLYTRADEKYARALSLASSNRQASISRVRAAGRRALLKRGRERLDLLTQAREQCVDMAGWNSQDPELWEEWERCSVGWPCSPMSAKETVCLPRRRRRSSMA